MKKLLLTLALLFTISGAFAQTTCTYPAGMIKCSFVNAALTSPTVSTVFTVAANGTRNIYVQCTPTGSALAAFRILAKTALATTMTTLYSAAGDYTSPVGVLVGASGDLTSLANHATGWFIINNGGFDTLQVTAATVTTPTTMTCYVSGQ